MKTNLKPLIFVPFLLLVSACGDNSNTNNPSNDGSSENNDNNSEVKPGGMDNYQKFTYKDYSYTYQKLRTDGRWEAEANQLGDVKALVVPIEFTDASADDLPAGRQGTLDDLNLAFFGGDKYENPELNWESVHSFYQKSSYGKCNITGTVMPWYNVGKTMDEFVKQMNFDTDLFVKKMYGYYSYGEGSKLINLADYDANKDGYVDIVYFIYSPKTVINENHNNTYNMWWAFTSQNTNMSVPDKGETYFSRYVWASYDFMYQDVNYTPAGGCRPFTPDDIKNNVKGVVDAHTYIHETGHGLALYDYYSTAYNGDEPMGKLDMMDHNIGDHNAWSKMMLGWVDPYVVTGNAKITLRPFNNSGDCILVPIRKRNWVNDVKHLMDEYIVIEYDTPEGLAEDDAFLAFGGEYKPKYYDRPGVRVMHADARMGEWSVSDDGLGLQFHNYIDFASDIFDKSHYPDLAHENDRRRTIDDNFLLQLVTRTGRRHVKGEAGNGILWQKGTSMDHFKMNSSNPLTGEKYDLGYSIKVTDLNDQGATIEIIENNK